MLLRDNAALRTLFSFFVSVVVFDLFINIYIRRMFMTHLGTQELETARLLLRRFVLDDAQAMYENWASDPEVTQFLTWPAHSSVDVSRSVLAEWISNYNRADYYQWAIIPKDVNQPIGSIAVVSQDDRVCKAHIGYCIGRPWWHQGYMSESLQAVINYLFDSVGMLRLDSRHDPRNPNSGAVMRKCGMQYEGILRQSDWNNQGICDACWYSILAVDRIENIG